MTVLLYCLLLWNIALSIVWFVLLLYCFECSLLLMVCGLNCVRGNGAHLDLDGIKKDQSPCMEMSSFLNTDGSSIIGDTGSSYIMQNRARRVFFKWTVCLWTKYKGLSVRMNFCTVASREIIRPDTSNHLRYPSVFLFIASCSWYCNICMIWHLHKPHGDRFVHCTLLKSLSIPKWAQNISLMQRDVIAMRTL